MLQNTFLSKFSRLKKNDTHYISVAGIDSKGIKQSYRTQYLLISGGIGSAIHQHCFTALDRAIELGSVVHYLTVADNLSVIVAELYNRAISHERGKCVFSNTLGVPPNPISISVQNVNERNGLCIHAVPREAKVNADDFKKVLDQLNTNLRKVEKNCVVVINGNSGLFARLRDSIFSLQEIKSVSIILVEQLFSSDAETSRGNLIFFEHGFAHMRLLGGSFGHDETQFAWIPKPLTHQPTLPIKLHHKPVNRPYQTPVFANS